VIQRGDTKRRYKEEIQRGDSYSYQYRAKPQTINPKAPD
jgi:hypothetical protein